jgi:hypothetical protein
VSAAVEILTTLGQLRRQLGREDHPFDAAIALNKPPEPDEIDRLERAGITMIVHPPVLRSDGTRSSLDEKCERLTAYAARYFSSLSAV